MKPLRVDLVDELNKLARQSTLHTLVCVLDHPAFSLPEGCLCLKTGFYVVLFEKIEEKACHDCQCCDFRELSLSFHAPGEVIEVASHPLLVRLLAFQADLFSGSTPGDRKPEHTFFHYTEGEALHISLREKQTIDALFDNLCRELSYGIDAYSRQLLASHINLFLDYCSRFYQRQFYLRTDLNKEVLSRFDRWLDDYILSVLPQKKRLPSYGDMAATQGMSLPYFTDMMQIETGDTLPDHIRTRLMEIAKRRIMSKEEHLEDIAAELGFSDMQSFNCLFKRLTGYSPKEYRENMN